MKLVKRQKQENEVLLFFSIFFLSHIRVCCLCVCLSLACMCMQPQKAEYQVVLSFLSVFFSFSLFLLSMSLSVFLTHSLILKVSDQNKQGLC